MEEINQLQPGESSITPGNLVTIFFPFHSFHFAKMGIICEYLQTFLHDFSTSGIEFIL